MTQTQCQNQGGLTLAQIQKQYKAQNEFDLVFNQNRFMIQNAQKAAQSNLHPVFEIALAGIRPTGGR